MHLQRLSRLMVVRTLFYDTNFVLVLVKKVFCLGFIAVDGHARKMKVFAALSGSSFLRRLSQAVFPCSPRPLLPSLGRTGRERILGRRRGATAAEEAKGRGKARTCVTSQADGGGGGGANAKMQRRRRRRKKQDRHPRTQREGGGEKRDGRRRRRIKGGSGIGIGGRQSKGKKVKVMAEERRKKKIGGDSSSFSLNAQKREEEANGEKRF